MRILSVGRAVEKKGYDDLVEALAKLPRGLAWRFEHVGGGLMAGTKDGKKPVQEVKDGTLKRFSVAGADGKWIWADATIDGDSVVVSSAKVNAPVAVRYAYTNNPEGANLYNREGLPASPFRTDADRPAKR